MKHERTKRAKRIEWNKNSSVVDVAIMSVEISRVHREYARLHQGSLTCLALYKVLQEAIVTDQLPDGVFYAVLLQGVLPDRSGQQDFLDPVNGLQVGPHLLVLEALRANNVSGCNCNRGGSACSRVYQAPNLRRAKKVPNELSGIMLV